MFDFVSALGRVIRLKAVTFVLDFIMMLLFSLSFFCLLIGYNSGQIRVGFLVLCLTGLCGYFLTFHRILKYMFDKIVKTLHKFFNNLSNSLKNIKKI